MAFKEVFGNTWKDYKNNFWAIFTIIVIFSLVPYLIVQGINYAVIPKDVANEAEQVQAKLLELQNLDATQLSAEQQQEIESLSMQYSTILIKMIPFLVISFVLGIISFLIALFGTAGIVYCSFKKKFSYSDAVKGAKKFYWKIIGLTIVQFLIFVAFAIAVGLFALILGLIYAPLGVIAIIVAAFVGIWLLLKLMFSDYILINENKKVFNSLGESFKLVKGKFWKALGNLVLYLICLLPIFILFFLLAILFVGVPLQSFKSLLIDNNPSGLIVIYILRFLISIFFIGPFSLLFLKNLYLELKKK